MVPKTRKVLLHEHAEGDHVSLQRAQVVCEVIGWQEAINEMDHDLEEEEFGRSMTRAHITQTHNNVAETPEQLLATQINMLCCGLQACFGK